MTRIHWKGFYAYCVLRIAYCVLRIAYCVLLLAYGVWRVGYGVLRVAHREGFYAYSLRGLLCVLHKELDTEQMFCRSFLRQDKPLTTNFLDYANPFDVRTSLWPRIFLITLYRCSDNLLESNLALGGIRVKRVLYLFVTFARSFTSARAIGKSRLQ